ncbi:Periplasmic pH-dependent serine endoprotease DegQ precursor [Pseudooceanicola marinus]|uniref:Periplasmic pH-dependent serine endoprotease DegQ n=1 Tax=Pseudooceanicola marinus TaxID=396013 RepID=A0A1X7ABI3_9RHOB|nr:trypsin-like peptidase domain-containing protein [Pseudooceanicola marinus]PJE26294.1 serine protease [Pseudooceanicola marinus]SLN74794.1 Periplasmic pH-dependent serine endoprotease DegQ precursor [Pseudooceanicola marinus]
MFRALAALCLACALALPAQARIPFSKEEITLSFAPLVKEATPAVVNIYAKRIVETRSSPFANDPIFSEFFRNFAPSRPRVQNSLGSGVILSDDGYVVSNYHVVGQADEIKVVLNDRREFDATVLLSDPQADLAILKLEGAQDMPHLELRDSDTVEVGELVLAIGNPFGVGQTVSSGIVSGLARSGTATGNERGYFIQTDAPINPGNSGGALIDINGDLIGVNTSILSRSGGSNGIGFAIPASLVAQVLDQAEAGNDRFQRPWAGITGQSVDADMAAHFGLDRPEGIAITQMHPASPFADAGFQPGDVILAVDGMPVSSPPEMIFRMTVAGLGNAVWVTRLRDGREREIEVTLAPPPEDPPRDPVTTGQASALPGMRLITVNPAVIAENQLPQDARGAMIDDPGAIGARAGLQRGDVIQAVNDTVVDGAPMAEVALTRANVFLQLTVLRDGRSLSLRFRL